MGLQSVLVQILGFKQSQNTIPIAAGSKSKSLHKGRLNKPHGDIRVPSFLDDLKIGMWIVGYLHYKLKLFQPSLAGYNAKRISARAFFARWKVEDSEILRRDLSHIAVLDGSWIGHRGGL